MAVQIGLTQVRETDPEGYRVENTVLDGASQTIGIDPELFVFQYVDGTANDIYQHVSMVNDVKDLPREGDTGWNTTGALYRKKTANLVYTNLEAAIDQAAYIKTRLQTLATDFETTVTDFEALSDTIEYKSADDDRIIELVLVCTQPERDEYKMVATISAAPTGIARELFTYKLDGPTPVLATDTYTRVATVDDIREYLDYAGWNGEAYYRYYAVDRTYTYLDTALATVADIKTKLAALVEEYDDSTDNFEGSETDYFTG